MYIFVDYKHATENGIYTVGIFLLYTEFSYSYIVPESCTSLIKLF